MLTGLQLGQAGGEDGFYTAVKARRNRKYKHNQHEEHQGGKSNQVRRVPKNLEEDDNFSAEVGDHQTEEQSTRNPPRKCRSNLNSFLESTRPCIAARHLSEKTMKDRRTCSIVFQPYFTLGDLWDSFVEWSAYGAGVPLVLDGINSAVQYYVPYLSAIQLYGEAMENTKSREDKHTYYNQKSSTDATDDNTFDGFHSLSVTNEAIITQESLSSVDRRPMNCSRGQLLFQFFEHEKPYNREPLVEKISDLACQYPGLKTLKSCDLLHFSWISIAWYPIYRIPVGTTLKHLDACFLTYHSLSIPSRGGGTYGSEIDGIPMISLPAFGLASYKFQESLWTHNWVSENQRLSSLGRAAENWLRFLKVTHPDFQFFSLHGTTQPR